ncbi:MAG: Ig-like domain-containing protein [Rhizobiaceae bacterium]|nr:Ig-like domain-containing protein [Rhizobiaceae bacterium]
MAIGFGSNITGVTINGTPQSGTPFSNLDASFAAAFSYAVKFEYDGTTYGLTIAKGAGSDSINEFEIAPMSDAEPPTLLSTSPAVGATAVAVGSNITLTFSEDIQAGTGSITLYKAGGTQVEVFDVASDVSISGATVTLDPTDDLLGEIGYYVQVGAAAIEDLAGNTFAGIADATTFNFETEDLSSPNVSIDGPSGLATGDFIVTITFTEDVTGFDASELQVTGGGLVGPAFVTQTGSVYTVRIIPTLGQVVKVNLRAAVAQDAAGNDNAAADEYSVQTGSAASAFEQRKDEIRRIVREQASDRLTTRLRANQRMLADVRERMIVVTSGEVQVSDGEDNASSSLSGYAPFDISGTVDSAADDNGWYLNTKGVFAGQSGFRDMVNWRLSGNFGVVANDGGGVLAAFDARIAREQLVRNGLMLGTFLGAEASTSDISDSFTGTQTDWGVFGGAYVSARLVDGLYADGFASIGYGEIDLDMSSGLDNGYDLSVDSTYGTLTWQVGGSLTGVFAMDGFEFRPNLAAAYGNTRLGTIGFQARAYGLTDAVSLNAGIVEIGTLRFTPEIRFALGGDGSGSSNSVLSLLPVVSCEYETVTDNKTSCGGGAGVGLLVRNGFGELATNIDYERLGSTDRYGANFQFNRAF